MIVINVCKEVTVVKELKQLQHYASVSLFYKNTVQDYAEVVLLFSIARECCKTDIDRECNEADIFLDNDDYGQVKVCLNGFWGSVCGEGWDYVDAETVCQQLGYNGRENSLYVHYKSF